MIGQTIAHYTITEKIGEGGMGEVYRATDTKLKRDVALKVLPESFTQDPQRMARFTREAQVLASLNHPNIGAIFGLEEEDGVRALALELIEGEDLSERIAKGPIALEEALQIALQIAEALEAAHEKGIIHRDLKPANVIVTPEGTVKVLDFGLAKAMEEGPTGSDVTHSPTLTMQATQAGIILGTAAYMSPEQAKGRRVGKMTDIFAFGAVLYELLSGQKAFLGDGVSEMLAAVIKTEPNWTALPAHVPSSIGRLLKRCLRKERSARLHDIADVRIAIEDARESADAPVPGRALAWWQRPLGLLAAGLALSAIIGSLTWFLSRAERGTDAQPTTRFTIQPAADLALDSRFSAPIISPDGRALVFVANRRLYTRAMNSLETKFIPGTEEARSPFFSPDGEWVGFLTDTHIKKVALSGGTPLTVCEASNGIVPAWGPGGEIIFGREGSTGLWRVSEDGGNPEPFSKLAEGDVDHDYPQVLPDGETVLYTISTTGNTGWDDAQLVAQNRMTGKREIVFEGGTNARYTSSGHLVYARSGSILAVPFDLKRLEVSGTSVTVVNGVAATFTGFAPFSISDSGALAYVPGGVSGVTGRLVWVDRNGREEIIDPEPRGYADLRISPDGARAALSIRGPDNNVDVRIYDFEAKTLSRLTTNPAEDFGFLWSQDSRRIYFSSAREGPHTIFWRDVSGTEPAERLVPSTMTRVPFSWSRDGTTLVSNSIPAETGIQIDAISLDDERSITPLIRTPFRENFPAVSPDGRWIAYESNESGQPEIYVRPFPHVDDNKWRVSRDGGTKPLWRSDGREIFYRDGNSVMATSVETSAGFEVGDPELLFERLYQPVLIHDYDVAPDGQKFLMVKPVEAVQQGLIAGQQIVIVLNWTEELKRLVPRDN